jgi:Large polyvalent protein associated domain 23
MIMNEMNLEAWRHLLKPISSDGDGGNRLAQALNDYDPATGAPGNNGRLPSDPGIGFVNRQDQPQRGDQYATYVGEGAKGIDKDALQLAKQQQSSGGTRYDIWRNTGWTQGKDNKWRSEVDDSGATPHQSFNPSRGKPGSAYICLSRYCQTATSNLRRRCICRRLRQPGCGCSSD